MTRHNFRVLRVADVEFLVEGCHGIVDRGCDFQCGSVRLVLSVLVRLGAGGFWCSRELFIHIRCMILWCGGNSIVACLSCLLRRWAFTLCCLSHSRHWSSVFGHCVHCLLLEFLRLAQRENDVVCSSDSFCICIEKVWHVVSRLLRSSADVLHRSTFGLDGCAHNNIAASGRSQIWLFAFGPVGACSNWCQ